MPLYGVARSLRCDDAPPVPSHGVRLVLSRPLRVPIDEAFAWWTDPSEDDPRITREPGLVERIVMHRTTDAVWTRDLYRFFGARVEVDSRVDLRPPHAWTLVSESDLHGVRAHYSLTKEAPESAITTNVHVFARNDWVHPVLVSAERLVRRRQETALRRQAKALEKAASRRPPR